MLNSTRPVLRRFLAEDESAEKEQALNLPRVLSSYWYRYLVNTHSTLALKL